MRPLIATLICLLFIAYIFWTDRDRKEGPYNALWIPFLWMFFAGGRSLAEWLHMGSPGGTPSAYDQGNPINAAFTFLLIAAGIFILSRRNIDWGQFISKNKLIWLYLLYCLISILWSDYSYVSFKRWTKEVGNLAMVLVILTEERPSEAFGYLIRRLSFLWLPLSVLFIKYYPALARGYAPGGGMMYTGVATQKNGLGQLCLICAIFYAWHYLLASKDDFKFGGRDNIVDLILIGMLIWLFHMAQSATSFTCAIAAVTLFGAGRLTAGKPGRIMTWAVVAALLFFALNSAFNLKDAVIHMLGRKPNLTDRTHIWAIVGQMAANPWVGAGYQGFWLGHRLKVLWGEIGMNIIQAHDGYLEQYLDLGYIGVAFIIAIMFSGILKVRRQLYRDYPTGVLMLCLILVAALYNYTEASFYAISNIWLLLVLAVTEIPEQGQAHEKASAMQRMHLEKRPCS